MPTGLSPDPLAKLAPTTSHDIYAGLRRDAPVHWSSYFGGWVLTRYADAVRVLADPTFFIDDPTARLSRIEQRGGPSFGNFRILVENHPLHNNPPDHTRWRRFTAGVVRRLETSELRRTLEQKSAQLLREARENGGIDLAGGYGDIIARFTIHVLLGLSYEECAAVADSVRRFSWIFDATPRLLREMVQAEAEAGRMLDQFEREIGERRRHVRNDGLSLIISLADSELGLGDRELAGFCVFFFIGMLETSANGVSVSSLHLLSREAERARLVAEPEGLPAFTRECLRLAAPFQYAVRFATEECMIGDQRVSPGERVYVVLAAANHDPAAFPDPDVIDPARSGPESLAFGGGAHRCLGAGLAQVETEASLVALLGAPDLRLDPETVAWHTQTRVPGLAHAWASFSKA